MTAQGKIFADKPGDLQHQSTRMAGLAAHRYYPQDYLGRSGSYVMATNVGDHENLWTFERIGSFDHLKYMICLANNLLDGDRVNPTGWALTPEEPLESGQKNW